MAPNHPQTEPAFPITLKPHPWAAVSTYLILVLVLGMLVTAFISMITTREKAGSIEVFYQIAIVYLCIVGGLAAFMAPAICLFYRIENRMVWVVHEDHIEMLRRHTEPITIPWDDVVRMYRFINSITLVWKHDRDEDLEGFEEDTTDMERLYFIPRLNARAAHHLFLTHKFGKAYAYRHS